MGQEASRVLLTDDSYQAELAYDRWHRDRRSWRAAKPGADWQTDLLPFFDRLTGFGINAMVPFQLIGSCEVYLDQDGRRPMREEYTFIIGGSQHIGGASLYIGRWKGLFNKRIEDALFTPVAVVNQVTSSTSFEACYPEVTNQAGNTTAAAQFVGSGLPVLRLAWWGRDRERADLIATAQLFINAMNA